MGQTCIGIIVGVEDKGTRGKIDWTGEDGDGGLIGDYCKAKRIDRYAGKRTVNTFPDGNKSMVGVLAMVGGSGEDGIPYIGEDCMRLAEIADHDGVKAARKEWDKFAAWAKKAKGLDLPTADVWMVPTETA